MGCGPIENSNKKSEGNGSPAGAKKNVKNTEIIEKGKTEEPIERIPLDFAKYDSIINEYTFIDKIGKGAFGQVYKAVNKKTGEERAVKEIGKTGPNNLSLFDEAAILKKLVKR